MTVVFHNPMEFILQNLALAAAIVGAVVFFVLYAKMKLEARGFKNRF